MNFDLWSTFAVPSSAHGGHAMRARHAGRIVSNRRVGACVTAIVFPTP